LSRYKFWSFVILEDFSSCVVSVTDVTWTIDYWHESFTSNCLINFVTTYIADVTSYFQGWFDIRNSYDLSTTSYKWTFSKLKLYIKIYQVSWLLISLTLSILAFNLDQGQWLTHIIFRVQVGLPIMDCLHCFLLN